MLPRKELLYGTALALSVGILFGLFLAVYYNPQTPQALVLENKTLFNIMTIKGNYVNSTEIEINETHHAFDIEDQYILTNDASRSLDFSIEYSNLNMNNKTIELTETKIDELNATDTRSLIQTLVGRLNGDLTIMLTNFTIFGRGNGSFNIYLINETEFNHLDLDNKIKIASFDITHSDGEKQISFNNINQIFTASESGYTFLSIEVNQKGFDNSFAWYYGTILDSDYYDYYGGSYANDNTINSMGSYFNLNSTFKPIDLRSMALTLDSEPLISYTNNHLFFNTTNFGSISTFNFGSFLDKYNFTIKGYVLDSFENYAITSFIFDTEEVFNNITDNFYIIPSDRDHFYYNLSFKIDNAPYTFYQNVSIFIENELGDAFQYKKEGLLMNNTNFDLMDLNGNYSIQFKFDIANFSYISDEDIPIENSMVEWYWIIVAVGGSSISSILIYWAILKRKFPNT